MNLRYLVAASCLLGTSLSHAIEIDGDIKDWIAQPEGQADDWTPTDSSVKYWVDDVEIPNSGYLNPGYGGQAYDAEAIYVKKGETSIDIAIVTGLDPDGNNAWPAGDIALDFGFPHNDDQETTEILNRSFEFGLVTRDDGFGISAAPGTLFSVVSWNYGLWDAPDQEGQSDADFRLAHPATIQSGTELLPATGESGAGLVYKELTYDGDVQTDKLGAFDGRHFLIEASIPWKLLLENTDRDLRNESFLVHWTMACANDFVEVDPPAGSVPTPAPALLLLAGLIPLLRRQR